MSWKIESGNNKKDAYDQIPESLPVRADSAAKVNTGNLGRNLGRERIGSPAQRASFGFLARTLNQIGEPRKPNAARIWFSRKRWNEK
jgi:hypothetical protein